MGLVSNPLENVNFVLANLVRFRLSAPTMSVDCTSYIGSAFKVFVVLCGSVLLMCHPVAGLNLHDVSIGSVLKVLCVVIRSMHVYEPWNS